MRPSLVSSVWRLGVFLMAVDALLLLANVIHQRVNPPYDERSPIFSSWVWNGDLDGSLIEFFGHVQLIVAVVAILYLGRVRRSAVYRAWAVVLGFLVLDDMLRLHELGGYALKGAVDLPSIAGLLPQDLGELSVWALAAAVLCPILAVAHRRATGVDRKISRNLLVLTSALAFFTVIVDLTQAALVPHIPRLASALVALGETAGELGVMTLILLVVYGLARQSTSATDRVDGAQS